MQKGVFSYNPNNNSGIEYIVTDSDNSAETFYDLSGRIVSNPQPGTIHLKRGKKIIVK